MESRAHGAELEQSSSATGTQIRLATISACASSPSEKYLGDGIDADMAGLKLSRMCGPGRS